MFLSLFLSLCAFSARCWGLAFSTSLTLVQLGSQEAWCPQPHTRMHTHITLHDLRGCSCRAPHSTGSWSQIPTSPAGVLRGYHGAQQGFHSGPPNAFTSSEEGKFSYSLDTEVNPGSFTSLHMNGPVSFLKHVTPCSQSSGTIILLVSLSSLASGPALGLGQRGVGVASATNSFHGHVGGAQRADA
jgi:hypothetical protein